MLRVGCQELCSIGLADGMLDDAPRAELETMKIAVAVNADADGEVVMEALTQLKSWKGE